MNNLMVKEVEFEGAVLKACQNEDTKKIYVGVSWICNGLGLSKSQKDTQVQKVQTDLVLKQGCLKFQAGVFDENNETLSLDIEFLPLWLAKITLTPKMQSETPFLVTKLVEYQLKAKDVLAKAFIKDNQVSNELRFLQGLLDGMKEQELAVKRVEEQAKITNNKVIHLETEFNKETVSEGYVTNDNIARKLYLYSTKDKPHFGFVDAVAKQLRIYNTNVGYKDEYINVIRTTNFGGTVGTSVYYSEKAIEMISDYIKENFKPTPSQYVRGAKKGNFKDCSFELGRINFKFNENTYNQYK